MCFGYLFPSQSTSVPFASDAAMHRTHTVGSLTSCSRQCSSIDCSSVQAAHGASCTATTLWPMQHIQMHAGNT